MRHEAADLHVREPSTHDAWNLALLDLPSPHLLQTWEWGEFKSRYGWSPSRYLWVDPGSDQPRAAASVLTRRVGWLPLKVMYVPKGPILDYSDGALLEDVLGRLESLAQQERALFIKIDPDVRTDTSTGEAVKTCLERQAWLQSEEEIQFRNTLLLDLRPSLDDLLMGMKSKWRYNVRLAKRKGVTVRQGSEDDLALLYDMYEETADRGDFVIRPEAYYEDAWGIFIRKGLAQPFVAEVEGVPVAMVIIYRFGDRAYYLHGASRSIHRDKMPNNRLQWEAIQWAKKRGCTVYDMWGAPDTLDESDPMWGVYRFKKGFGGELVKHIGAWDYPVLKTGYHLYMGVKPRMLAVMRSMDW